MILKLIKKIGIPEDVPVQQQKDNQKAYEHDRHLLQVGDHVFLDFPPSTMEKGFDSPVSASPKKLPTFLKKNVKFISFVLQNYQVYKIIRVDAGKSPTLYKLADILDGKVPGYYYKEQLVRTEAPKPENFFRIQDILKTEWRGNIKYHLVKYLHYPDKFNKWIPESDLLK